MFGSVITAAAPRLAAPSRIRYPNRVSSRVEMPKWDVFSILSHYPNQDIDWYRKKYGKAEGEAKFFATYQPESTEFIPGNMLLGNGASALWQFMLGNGTASANSALGSGPTYYNNSQTYLYIGDAGITAGTGTISITNGGTTITFGSSQSGLQGKYIIMVGDTTNGIYFITGGSGTSWTIGSGGPSSTGSTFGGTTLSGSSAGWSTFASESHSQTALSGSSNTAHQIMDATFPANSTSAQFNAISAATDATPIVLTISGGDISTNDIVQVYEVQGNTGANGMWVANPASASSVTLLGSVGNASYTFGGIVTKRSVCKFQATFGPGVGQWTTGIWEWALVNGTGGNQNFLNHKIAALGTKTGGSTSLQVSIGLG